MVCLSVFTSKSNIWILLNSDREINQTGIKINGSKSSNAEQQNQCIDALTATSPSMSISAGEPASVT